MNRNEFNVISGGKKEKLAAKEQLKKIKEEHYRTLYYDSLYSDEQDIAKTVFFGVKYVKLHTVDTTTSYRDVLQFFIEINEISRLMEQLTFAEIMQVFPITKDFDGWKYEAKDYWSTKEYLKEKNFDSKLSSEVDEFLWTYYNLDIINFGVKKTLIADKLLKMEGRQGILESFLDVIDPEKEIHTYTVHKDQGYIYDNTTGKTAKLVEPKKRKPNYLEVLS